MALAGGSRSFGVLGRMCSTKLAAPSMVSGFASSGRSTVAWGRHREGWNANLLANKIHEFKMVIEYSSWTSGETLPASPLHQAGAIWLGVFYRRNIFRTALIRAGSCTRSHSLGLVLSGVVSSVPVGSTAWEAVRCGLPPGERHIGCDT